jgi:sulfur carrier protein ThiS adenylyltransferase
MSNNDRYSRQKDIVPAERISQCKATVIGIGAIGRQVALQLAAIGIPELQLVDFDLIEESNIASQGYFEEDLGKFKVDATSAICWKINSNLQIDPHTERFRKSMKIGNCVFNCVDSIETRKLIWQAVKDRVGFYCDARMSAEVLRVLTACNSDSFKYYPTTLFSASEAYRGACTAKTTIYCANIAAGLMLSQFTQYLRHLPVEPDIQVNLLASEMNLNTAGG